MNGELTGLNLKFQNLAAGLCMDHLKLLLSTLESSTSYKKGRTKSTPHFFSGKSQQPCGPAFDQIPN